MTPTTSPKLLSSPISAAVKEPPKPQAIKVAIADLATEFGTTVPTLWQLIRRGYLRLADKTDSCFTTTIEIPGPAAYDWLRQMFAPLRLRPYLPLFVAAELYGITVQEARMLCLQANVVFQFDPVFGEVMPLTAWRDLGQALFCARRPLSFDRQTLLETFSWMLDFAPKPRGRPDKIYAVPRSVRIEREIQRIAAMKEPERAMRAIEFFAAYRDARTVAEACARRKPTPILRGLDAKVSHIGSAIRNQLDWSAETKVRKKRERPPKKKKVLSARQRFRKTSAFRRRTPSGFYGLHPLRAAGSTGSSAAPSLPPSGESPHNPA